MEVSPAVDERGLGVRPFCLQAEAMIGPAGDQPAHVVSDRFDGCTLLKKQQMVLDSVKAPLATGDLHAITVKAYTPDEWARR